MKNDYLVVSDRVQQAIDKKMPVIAIETSGMYLGMTGGGVLMDGVDKNGVHRIEGETPDYFKIADNVEKLIIQNGAVPALVAVIDGKIYVGLDSEKRKYLNDNRDKLQRICKSDLPLCVAMPCIGVTTVSATMMIAQMVGIMVVASLYVGGVSSDFGDSQKVSSDLHEMAHNRMVVVATGINPGCDPVRTLGYLETHGIPTVGFRTDKFYTNWLEQKEHPLRYRIDDPSDIAATLAVKRSLDIDGSILVLNPSSEIPSEEDSNDADKNAAHLTSVMNDNVTLAAWIAMAISMDLDPNINNKNSKRSTIPKKEKSMSFEVWLFAVKKFAQNYDVALLIFNNLPDSEKERLRQEYEDTVD